jgi:ADP-heptose:LPS heptosyltransferase
MLSDKSGIHKILVISLSNIGDVILTFPVIDVLAHDFPCAGLSLVVGPKAEGFFKGNPSLDKVYIFDKKQPLRKTVSWVFELYRQRFDCVVDLRHTAIPFLIFPKYRTSLTAGYKGDMHMKQKHLRRLRTVHTYDCEPETSYALFISEEDRLCVSGILDKELCGNQRYVVVAPGAADQNKKWPEKGLAEICGQMIRKYPVAVVLVGGENDAGAGERIAGVAPCPIVNLCGRTTLVQLAEVIRRSLLVIANDSAPMHLASYLNKPVLALFGPTDARKYGPWSANSRYIRKDQFCPACQNPRGSSRHTCMESITSQEILDSFDIIGDEVVFTRLRGNAP